MGSVHVRGFNREPPSPPVVFNRLHGNNIQLTPNWCTAKRLRGFEHSIVFTNPITLNNYIDIRINVADETWQGSLRVGLTTQHPGCLMRQELPACACPKLTERDKFWLVPVPTLFCTKSTFMYLYVKPGGQLMVGRTVAEKRRLWEEQELLYGIPTDEPLWMVFDVYGQTTEIQIFKPKTSIIIDRITPNNAKLNPPDGMRYTGDPLTENAFNASLLQEQTGESPPETVSPIQKLEDIKDVENVEDVKDVGNVNDMEKTEDIASQKAMLEPSLPFHTKRAVLPPLGDLSSVDLSSTGETG